MVARSGLLRRSSLIPHFRGDPSWKTCECRCNHVRAGRRARSQGWTSIRRQVLEQAAPSAPRASARNHRHAAGSSARKRGNGPCGKPAFGLWPPTATSSTSRMRSSASRARSGGTPRGVPADARSRPSRCRGRSPGRGRRSDPSPKPPSRVIRPRAGRSSRAARPRPPGGGRAARC